jgi:hypothetical protein
MTCVSRKVKCDEQSPLCGGCRRLDLQCRPRTSQPQLSSRRRGAGPVKDRVKTDWKPSKILPMPPPDHEQFHGSHGSIDDGSMSHQSANSPASSTQDGKVLVPDDIRSEISSHSALSAVNRWLEDPIYTLELSNSSIPCTALASLDFWTGAPMEGVPTTSSTLDTGSTIVINKGRQHGSNYAPSTSSLPGNLASNNTDYLRNDPTSRGDMLSDSQHPQTSESMTDFVSHWIQKGNAASPLASFLPVSNDSQALFYFRENFTRLKSMRNPEWSAHTVFLQYALQRQMAMHFLLAVSHHELVIYQGLSPRLPEEARGHYETGSQLLYQSMTGERHTDHMSVMMSFLYMYVFWIRRDPVQVKRLKPLSRSVCSYIKGVGLDTILKCNRQSETTWLVSHSSPNHELEDQAPDETILSRLLVYIYDRDVYCSFYGCGGYFANYLDTDERRRRAIWTASRASLRTYWGGMYPINEAMLDFEDETTQGMHFDLIIISQLVNVYSQGYDQDGSTEKEAGLMERLDRLRTVRKKFKVGEVQIINKKEGIFSCV